MAIASGGDVGYVIDKVAFLKKLPQLSAATSDDEISPAGHVYREISDLTLASGSYCQDILDFLVDRLTHPSCHVKFKVLKLMQFLVTHGHPQFRQHLRRRNTSVTEATKVSGPVGSSLLGKELYCRVRKEAEILCEALFHVDSDDAKVPQPFSSSVINTGGMGAQRLDSRGMEGFGNTSTDANRSLGSRLSEQIVKFVDAAIDPLPTRPVVTTESLNKSYFVPQPMDPVASDLHPSRWLRQPCNSSRSSRTRRSAHRPGVAGGGWDDNSSGGGGGGSQPSTDDTNGDSLLNAVMNSSECLQRSDVADVRRRDSVDGRETDLVDEVVAPSQSTADIPNRREIAAFRKLCATLNCDVVVKRLNDKLTNESSTVLMRSLVLLESLLNSDLVSADHISDTCGHNLQYIRTRDDASNGAKSKCRKLLLILQKFCNSEFINKSANHDVCCSHRTED